MDGEAAELDGKEEDATLTTRWMAWVLNGAMEDRKSQLHREECMHGELGFGRKGGECGLSRRGSFGEGVRSGKIWFGILCVKKKASNFQC